METISEEGFLKYNPDTLDKLRKQYGFDTPARMTEAIQILEEWLKKQEHFVKKEFPKEYLERLIIHNKGSIEKTKKKLDKICTLRTLIPNSFAEKDPIEMDKSIRDSMMDIVIPIMTPDHNRVCLLKAKSVECNAHIASEYINLHMMLCEYLQYYDYNDGLIYLGDWRSGHPVSFSKSLNIVEFKKFTDIIFEGFSMRVKALHLVTESPLVSILVTFIKQIVNEKISSRIQVHTSLDTVYQHIPRHILPAEYGGDGKPLEESRDDMLTALNCEEFKRLRREMYGAATNEALRPKDSFYDQYMGMAGTFRNLSVD